jgi:hypothetical protein
LNRQQALVWLKAQFGEEAQFLTSWIAELEDKSLRFDLDQAGIENREHEAQELIELRAWKKKFLKMLT